MIGVTKGDTSSLDYSSDEHTAEEDVRPCMLRDWPLLDPGMHYWGILG